MRPQDASANSEEYRRAFIASAHRLLALGHARMDARSFSTAEEPVITGELRDAMNAVIDEPEAEDWLHFLYVEDEHHVKDPRRKGKRRNKLDIRVTGSRPRPRNHFSWEAKRFGPNNPVGDYLGAEGLGCFLRGDYAAEEDQAGMIAYVQSGSVSEWAERLRDRLTKAPGDYAVENGFCWAAHPFPLGPEHGFHSRHLRQNLGRALEVFHSLLGFN
jgi:hypothetical protein